MDLSDAFESDKKSRKPGDFSGEIADALAESGDELEATARTAAQAFDEAEFRRRLYENRRSKLMEGVEQAVEELKQSWKEAQEACNSSCEALQEMMEAEGITKIPMSDRKPVQLKVTAGRKRNISKKWLTEALGKKEANEIWSKVPTYPEKKEIVIHPRFEDEPSD